MADKTAEEIDQDEVATADAGDDVVENSADTYEAEPSVSVKAPEFQPLKEAHVAKNAKSMEYFYDVRVPVWAELGRVEVTIGELLQLGEGTVLRLERPVGEPVDLVSQGVTLARGEVVVVDDCFAIRIKEIHCNEKA